MWAEDFPGLIKVIGVCDVAGAIGLVLPAVTGVARWLVYRRRPSAWP
jgi:hypothetical protein